MISCQLCRRRFSVLAVLALMFGLSFAALPPAHASDSGAFEHCEPAGGLKFLCGIQRPEDLVLLPGGKWIIASGLGPGGGLHLIDVRAKTWKKLVPVSILAPTIPYGNCPKPLAEGQLQAHGLSLRANDKRNETLYVVNHGGRESIEVFDVSSSVDKPDLTWRGCLVMPTGLAANAVTSSPDGTVFITVMLHPGMRMGDLIDGRPTGAVYEWRPGDAGFERVWGTELSADNGIELSADGKTMYVAATGTRSVTAFTATNPAKKLRATETLGFGPDNLRWSDGKLLTAGMNTDEPRCGGRLKNVNGAIEPINCPRGYTVAAIDTSNMSFIIVASGPATPGYSNVSTGLLVGTTIWLGSSAYDKVAYRDLPK